MGETLVEGYNQLPSFKKVQKNSLKSTRTYDPDVFGLRVTPSTGHLVVGIHQLLFTDTFDTWGRCQEIQSTLVGTDNLLT